MLQEYFENRKSLHGLILVVDARRELQDFDRQMIEFAKSVSLPIHVLLTKADKLKRGKAATALLQVKKELGETATVQLFSALNRQGVDEARETLERFLRARSSWREPSAPGLGLDPANAALVRGYIVVCEFRESSANERPCAPRHKNDGTS